VDVERGEGAGRGLSVNRGMPVVKQVGRGRTVHCAREAVCNSKTQQCTEKAGLHEGRPSPPTG
jgi:hypothetical protein